MGKEGPCCHCGIEQTPLWRNGPPEKPVLCNACGSRWRTRGTLADYTPKHAMKDVQGAQTIDGSDGHSGSTSTSGPNQLVFENAPRRNRSDLDQYILTPVGRLCQQLLDFAQEQPEVYLRKPVLGDVLIDRADVSTSNPLGTALGAALLVSPLEENKPPTSECVVSTMETATESESVENNGDQGEPPVID